MSEMNIVCLDLEGVLVPEIWIAFAEASGIPELKRTTRDEPDYDKHRALSGQARATTPSLHRTPSRRLSSIWRLHQPPIPARTR